MLSANRRLLAAMNALASLRKLLRPVSVEIHQAPAVSQATSIIAGPANGDMPEANEVPATRLRRGSINGSAKPVNGVNRINGKLNGRHNRLGQFLEPTVAE